MTKLTELQSLKASGYITVPFSIAWSEDNFLAFVTDRGVNVVEVRFNGVSKEGNIHLKRWFIKPRKVTPTNNCMINVAKLAETLGPDELYKLMLDRTLSPRASLNGAIINVLAVAWSPFNHKLHQNSLLTILTDQGSLDIYNHEESSWTQLTSISEHWLNLCSKSWNNNELNGHSPSGLVNELKKRAYCVKISSFSWGKCHDDKWFSLFTANLAGQIMMWKVKIDESGVEVTNLLVSQTDLDSNCCLHCLNLDNDLFMLMAGCTNGKIQCLSIKDNAVKAKSMIWSDMDQLPIPINSPVAAVCPEGILYIVPKLSHLLLFWLDRDANLINFSTYSTDDFYVSGIMWLKGCEFLVSTRNGCILIVKMNISSNSLDVAVEKGEPFLKNNLSYSYHGISHSKNRCILAVAHSVCAAHDPSLLKEPSTVTLFSMADCIDPEDFLKLTASSLKDIWDHMELIRLECFRKTEEVQLSNESMENYAIMNITKMKKVYWLKRISLNISESSKLETSSELKLLCWELKRAIITFNLFSRVNNLMKKDEMPNVIDNSLVCAKIWFRQYCSDGQFKTYKKKAEILLNYMKSLKLQDKENCPLCDSECKPIHPDLVMECSLGHKVPRCSQTLLPIINPPYFICGYCGETTSYGAEENNTCILCDAPLRLQKSLLRSKENN